MENNLLYYSLSEIIVIDTSKKIHLINDIINAISNIHYPNTFESTINNIISRIFHNLKLYYSPYTIKSVCIYLNTLIPLLILFRINIDIILPPKEYDMIISTLSFHISEDTFILTTNTIGNDELSFINFDKNALAGYKYHINYLLDSYNTNWKIKNIKYYYSNSVLKLHKENTEIPFISLLDDNFEINEL